MFLAATLIDG